MARKKAIFQSIRDDQDGDPPDVGVRPDRRANRQESRDLKALAIRISELPPSSFAALPLDPALVDEINALRKLGPEPARRRQIKRVSGFLRVADLDAIQRELDGEGVQATRMHMLERWRRRILEHGDEAIQAFMDVHDGVDRGQLRALARQASGEGKGAPKAAKRLFAALKEATEKEPEDAPTDSD